MISSDEVPDTLAEWIREHAVESGCDLAAINTAIIIYDGFDSDGGTAWNYLVMSEDSVFKIVGLMEVAKIRMMAYQVASSVNSVQGEIEYEEEDEDEENDSN